MIKRVAIIGAGVSGLAAAMHLDRLAGENVQITLYEARREAGGRTRSYIDRETGDTLDNGQHLLMGCYRDTLEYSKLLGTLDQIDQQETLEIPFYLGGGKQKTLRLAKLPSPLHLLWGLATTNLLSVSEKLAAIRFGQALKSKSRSFEQMTCEELFAATRQPKSLVQKLWEPMVLAVLNAASKDASAEAFVEAFRLIYFGKRQDASLIFPRKGLSDLLIDPAITHLERRHTIELGSSIEAVSADLQIKTSGGLEAYDAVIVASSVGPELSLPIAIPKVEYSPILNAYFWIDREILHSPVTAFIDTDLQWAFVRPTTFGAQRLALTVSAASSLINRSNEELTKLLWDELQTVVPTAATAKLMKSQIIKEKRATPLFTPAAHATRPNTVTSIEGLFLAGDIVQNGLPATIEGAVRNGKAAAHAAHDLLLGMNRS